MVPDWRNGAPLPCDGDAFVRQHCAPDHLAQPRPNTGSRKRKAYMPRNSGYEAAASSSHGQQQHSTKKRATVTKPTRPAPQKMATETFGMPLHPTAGAVAAPPSHTAAHSTGSHPSSPAAGSSKALSTSAVAAGAQRCGSGTSSAAAAPAVQAGGMAGESLATTRSRRVIKRREKFDPHMFELSGDLEEAEESRSDNSSETLSRRSCHRKSVSGMLPCLPIPHPPAHRSGGAQVPNYRHNLHVLSSVLYPKDAHGMCFARWLTVRVHSQMGDRW